VALEVTAAEMAFLLHVADERLDGGASPQLAFDDAEDAALLAGDEDASRLRRVVTAVSLVDVGALDLASGEALGILDGGAQGVAVVGIARQCGGMQDELAARGTGIGGDDRDLDAELVGDVVIGPTGTVRVMVATKPVDFRKGMEGLAALVREAMGADPFCGTVYVFRAKRADRVKLIFWDGTGMVLVAKRLEDGKFRWPGVQDTILRLSAAELQALLEGLDWRRVHEPRQTAVPTATS
jgi:transposase